MKPKPKNQDNQNGFDRTLTIYEIQNLLHALTNKELERLWQFLNLITKR